MSRGDHLRMALNLIKYVLFIRTVHMLCFSKICSEYLKPTMLGGYPKKTNNIYMPPNRLHNLYF